MESQQLARSSHPRLAEKVALVTGAASGIGEAIARRFLQEGATVYALDMRSAVTPAGVTVRECDVTQEEHVVGIVTEMARSHGRIDIAVNVAGIFQPDGGHDIETGVWDRILDVNLSGTMRVCRAVLQVMVPRRSGAIVNVSSVAAHNGPAGQASYSASKGGVVAFTRSIANRYGPEGIRANCLCPGWVRTPATEREMGVLARASGITLDEQFMSIAPSIALRRVSTPDELAKAALFLASDDASYVTGVSLMADGGLRSNASSRAT
ncbi:SDR family NAD(P)-dependent oxidoreductase [Cupriavidus numazuensis]|uniref:Oxidoreductase UcpA n=1 Tax=Cupriavidus numazuensis TaxID=221992 RepID=A0ABM8TLF1_9BURK|nr:SDR family oxidoreductase [Cupriavidus numazuensis]CAG2153422.1 Oxidoreductase UcpA [Cupriavidus numazuensis]